MSRKSWEKFLSKGAFGGKSHKFGAKRMVTADGISHASTGQGKRWEFLLRAKAYGLIKNLKREVPFDLEVNGVKVCRYVADHVFELAGDLAREAAALDKPLLVVEDFKGTITPEAKIKMKLFAAVHGYEVHVVKTPEGAFY